MRFNLFTTFVRGENGVIICSEPPEVIEVLLESDAPCDLENYDRNIRPIYRVKCSGSVVDKVSGKAIKYNYYGIPLVHASAATIHSLQGCTKKTPIVIETDLKKGFPRLDSVAMYVAISRVTSFSNLFFTTPWTLQKLKEWKPQEWMLNLEKEFLEKERNTIQKYELE